MKSQKPQQKEPEQQPAPAPDTSNLGRVPTTCVEHAYGTTTRLSFQIKVF
jgi:hypothetical protein